MIGRSKLTDLSALIERVESGTGEDAALDGQIFDALSSLPVKAAHEAVLDRRRRPNWLPRYTSSLDAVLSLIEEKLPGWVWLRKESGTMLITKPPVGYRVGFEGDLPYPARALLAAALRAIQESRNADR
jgi:hypothetical protein